MSKLQISWRGEGGIGGESTAGTNHFNKPAEARQGQPKSNRPWKLLETTESQENPQAVQSRAEKSLRCLSVAPPVNEKIKKARAGVALIALRLEAIARRLEAIAIRLEAIAKKERKKEGRKERNAYSLAHVEEAESGTFLSNDFFQGSGGSGMISFKQPWTCHYLYFKKYSYIV